MKLLIFLLSMLLTLSALAEGPCDVRPGTSVGVKVVEFVTGHIIHSKMPMSEAQPKALLEEMTNLQDMGVCEENILARKCILKFEKLARINYISLYRGAVKWNSWKLKSKTQAQDYVKNLKRAGFCT